MNIFSLLLGKQYNVLAYLPDAVLVADDKGKIYYANKSAFRLFETQKLKGRNLNDFFILHSDNFLLNRTDNMKQVLKIITEEQNTKITDVKVIDVSSDKNKRYILSIIDNTQDHSLLEQLIAERQEQKFLNHTKNVLLIKMANYLRSPLHSIVGFSQAMLEGLSGELNEKQAKYINIINSNSSELLLLINKLIELSQIESDLYKFEFGNFDAAALLSVIVNESKVKLQNKDIKLNVASSDLVKQNCYSDKNVIKGIISNLIDNAINCIETGSITINISNPLPEYLLTKGFEVNNDINEKSYLMLELDCKGIDASQYDGEDVFNPYLQADKNSKKYLLQSLLLGSTKRYLNKLKGEIWINSRYENQTSFCFIVPAEKSIAEIK